MRQSKVTSLGVLPFPRETAELPELQVILQGQPVVPNLKDAGKVADVSENELLASNTATVSFALPPEYSTSEVDAVNRVNSQVQLLTKHQHESSLFSD